MKCLVLSALLLIAGCQKPPCLFCTDEANKRAYIKDPAHHCYVVRESPNDTMWSTMRGEVVHYSWSEWHCDEMYFGIDYVNGKSWRP